jgi:hypothetical protein
MTPKEARDLACPFKRGQKCMGDECNAWFDPRGVMFTADQIAAIYAMHGVRLPGDLQLALVCPKRGSTRR